MPRVAARRVPVAGWVALAVAVGVVGPFLRHLDDGAPHRAALVVLIGAAVALLASLALRLSGGVALAALGGAIIVAASPTGAHRASAVAVGGVVVAHAALVGWRPWPGWPTRRAPRVGLAVAPVVAASVMWLRHGPISLIAGVLAVALLIVEAHHRWPEVAERLSGGVQRAVDRVGVAVSTGVVLVVALPFVYLPGAVGAAWARWRPAAGSTWVARQVSVGEEVAAAGRPFLAVPRTVRRRRHRAGLAVLVVTGLVVAGVVTWRTDRARPPQIARPGPTVASDAGGGTVEEGPVTFSDLPAYDGVEFADALQAEQREVSGSLREDPVTVTAIPDHDGEYTHVADGVRRTLLPDCDCPVVRMWWVGGSVAFGLGQRDEHSIASELVRLAEADGIALEVTNLAVPGWTVWQEEAAVSDRLADGDAPSLVVSFSGYNDAVSTLASGAVHGGVLPEPTLLRQDDLDAFLADGRTAADGGGAETLAEEAAARYRSTRDRLARLLAEQGSMLRSFFQPDALADPAQLAPVRQVNPGIPARVATDLGAVLARTSGGVAPETADLRHIYDGTEDSVFVDWSHTNEEGARIAAEAVYRQLGPVLSTLAR